MKIDFDAFLSWAESRFDSLLVSDKEIKVNSPFKPDTKHHLWLNPCKGVYHCWKSDKSGSLTSLVSQIDNCTHKEAAEKIGATSLGSIRQLESRLEEMDKIKENKKIKLPPNTFSIMSLSKDNNYRKICEEYLYKRKLSITNLMICTSGEYKDRIVIPYYNEKEELIYWNARDVTGNAYLRYKGPKKEDCGVGKEDVVYFSEFPSKGSKVYLTEGEFDSISINLTNLSGCAVGGKNVSMKQMEILKDYKIVIAFDADKSGVSALSKLGQTFENYADKEIRYVIPPHKYKDWNMFLIDCGARVMRAYIDTNEKVFNSWTSILFSLKDL